MTGVGGPNYLEGSSTKNKLIIQFSWKLRDDFLSLVMIRLKRYSNQHVLMID